METIRFQCNGPATLVSTSLKSDLDNASPALVQGKWSSSCSGGPEFRFLWICRTVQNGFGVEMVSIRRCLAWKEDLWCG